MKMKLYSYFLVLLILLSVVACDNNAPENNNIRNELQEGENHAAPNHFPGDRLINYDHIYWEDAMKSGGISQPIFSNEELEELAKNENHKDYTFVVKKFVQDYFNKEIFSIQTTDFNPAISAPYRNVLVHTSDDLFFVITLIKWNQYNGIWTVHSYPEDLNSKEPDQPEKFEIIDGIPSYRNYGFPEIKNIVKHNFSLLTLENVTAEVREWAEEILSFDDWRIEFLHDLSKQTYEDNEREKQYEGDTYVLLTAPSSSDNSIVVDFINANSDEIGIHYNQIRDNDHERFGTVRYILLKFENLYTYNIFAIRKEPVIEYPHCNTPIPPDKPCPS